MKVDATKSGQQKGDISNKSSSNSDKQQHGLITELSFEDPLQAADASDRANKYGACDSRFPSRNSSLTWSQNSKKNHASGNFDTENKLSSDEQLTKLDRLALRVPCLGIMLALGASIFLGSAGMLVKMTQSVHGIQVAVFR